MQSASHPRRNFWRRVGALVIDWTLISFVFAVAAVTLQPLSPVALLAPLPIKVTACVDNAGKISKIDADRILPLREGEVRTAQFCTVSFFGLLPRHTQLIGAASRSDREGYSLTYHRQARVHVDSQGNPIRTLSVGGIAILLAPFVFATFLAQWSRTPGKAVFGLSITNLDKSPVRLATAASREIFKLLPLMGLAAYGLYGQLAVDPLAAAGQSAVLSASKEKAAGIGIALLFLAAAALIYWLLPFIRWRGQTFYDKWLKLIVDRTDKGPRDAEFVV